MQRSADKRIREYNISKLKLTCGNPTWINQDDEHSCSNPTKYYHQQHHYQFPFLLAGREMCLWIYLIVRKYLYKDK
ncbi:MAG TPA: hypothetical protein VHF08_05140 [Nitrososphaeraceae archaeon]|nr:hypothetical protein [Nitrososphaeraceae archaeon]